MDAGHADDARLIRVLAGGGVAAALPAAFAVEHCDDVAAIPARVIATAVEVVVARLDTAGAERLLAEPGWQPVLRDCAVLLALREPLDDELMRRLVEAGVQDICDAAEVDERRIRFALARKQREREARKAWSTDLATGLPNRDQLLEHLSQLLALRVRQPAPMALLVLRIDGLHAIGRAHGAEAPQLVRRKVAVRLRAAVRASDVVASLGGDAFALLLAKIETPADAQRVALKLARALREPFNVLGSAVGVTAHVGSALHPADGSEPQPLLRHAEAAALAAERRKTAAAND